MKAIRFNSVGGASGDMILGVLCDLGLDAADLSERLKTLVDDPFEIRHEKVNRSGLRGSLVTVNAPDSGRERHLGDIRDMVCRSNLPDRVKVMSMRVFDRLATAEAAVHGSVPERVHFHEVGALDSIIDIVGSCLGLTMLGVETVSCGTLPLGTGTTETQHGIMPVPVPATVELLKGYPVCQTGEPFELVTPTGAALVTTWNEAGAAVSGAVLGAGTGFGHRTLTARPNMLRAILAETLPGAGPEKEECVVIECNIDDTIPELVGALCGKLIRSGALDAFTVPAHMKKQRPGAQLTVLCRPDTRDETIDLIFRETTTFGLREYPVSRTVLARRLVPVETPYGQVRIKIGTWKGRDITKVPEHDDCVRCADSCNVSVRTVYETAFAAAGNAGT